MRKGIVGPLMAAVIIILIVVLAVGTLLQRDWNIMPEDETSLDLSRTQLRYLKEHDRVTIAVDEELAYLLGDGKDGYLQEYMGTALRPAGRASRFSAPRKRGISGGKCGDDKIAEHDDAKHDPVVSEEGEVVVLHVHVRELVVAVGESVTFPPVGQLAAENVVIPGNRADRAGRDPVPFLHFQKPGFTEHPVRENCQ